jgi:hypothetical protein
MSRFDESKKRIDKSKNRKTAGYIGYWENLYGDNLLYHEMVETVSKACYNAITRFVERYDPTLEPDRKTRPWNETTPGAEKRREDWRILGKGLLEDFFELDKLEK